MFFLYIISVYLISILLWLVSIAVCSGSLTFSSTVSNLMLILLITYCISRLQKIVLFCKIKL